MIFKITKKDVTTCQLYWGPTAIVSTVSSSFYKGWPSEIKNAVFFCIVKGKSVQNVCTITRFEATNTYKLENNRDSHPAHALITERC